MEFKVRHQRLSRSFPGMVSAVDSRQQLDIVQISGSGATNVNSKLLRSLVVGPRILYSEVKFKMEITRY
jgi:hypothetical protein